LAPTKKFDADDVARFLDLLPGTVEGLALRHASEARHPSFADARFVEMVGERGVAAVLAAASKYPEIAAPGRDFVYARIMGTRASEAAGYPAAELDAWAARAREWAERRDVFLYVISGEKV